MFRMGHHLLKAGLGVSGENALHHLRGLQQRRAMKVCRSTPTKQWELQRLKFTGTSLRWDDVEGSPVFPSRCSSAKDSEGFEAPGHEAVGRSFHASGVPR